MDHGRVVRALDKAVGDRVAWDRLVGPHAIQASCTWNNSLIIGVHPDASARRHSHISSYKNYVYIYIEYVPSTPANLHVGYLHVDSLSLARLTFCMSRYWTIDIKSRTITQWISFDSMPTARYFVWFILQIRLHAWTTLWWPLKQARTPQRRAHFPRARSAKITQAIQLLIQRLQWHVAPPCTSRLPDTFMFI